jgi:hypothetical protein
MSSNQSNFAALGLEGRRLASGVEFELSEEGESRQALWTCKGQRPDLWLSGAARPALLLLPCAGARSRAGPSVDRSLQLAYMKVAQQVAANKIDPAQARVLLQVLEKAGRSLPKSESMVERRFPGI